MFIHEAVKQAMEIDGCIIRNKIEQGRHFHPTRIKPTNSYATCIIFTWVENTDKSDRCKNWNPTADDLMADDWEVTKE